MSFMQRSLHSGSRCFLIRDLSADLVEGLSCVRTSRCHLTANSRKVALEQAPATLDLRLQVCLAIARCLELFLGDALLIRVEVRPFDLSPHPLAVALSHALYPP